MPPLIPHFRFRSFFPILALVGVTIFAAVALTSVPAHAQAADAAASLAVSTTDATADSTSTGTIIASIIAVVTGLLAIWQNKSATTAKKITQSVILGVEQATRLPEVQAAEKRIKETIRQKSKDLGVDGLLHEAVRDLTD